MSDQTRATASQRPTRRTIRRWIAGSVGLLTLIVLVLLTGPGTRELPLDPSSAQADGLLGLVRALEDADVAVEVTSRVPDDPGVRVFVPTDQLPTARRDELRRFARDGGTVVVAGSSPIHGLAQEPASLVRTVGRTTRVPACDELAHVSRVFHGDWSGLEVPDDAIACFPGEPGLAWLVSVAEGEGSVLALGSAAPFTNALLADEDNVVLAASLLGPHPGDRLVVLPRGEVGGGETPLLELVPAGVLRALWLLLAALLATVLWRSRRLGEPVVERLPPVLPSAELVHSVADLLQRAGDRGAAARRIREDVRHEVSRTLRVPVTTPAASLAELAVERATVAEADARLALLDAQVTDDPALTEVAVAAGRVREALARPPTSYR